jgi:hypothetical protein
LIHGSAISPKPDQFIVVIAQHNRNDPVGGTNPLKTRGLCEVLSFSFLVLICRRDTSTIAHVQRPRHDKANCYVMSFNFTLDASSALEADSTSPINFQRACRSRYANDLLNIVVP